MTARERRERIRERVTHEGEVYLDQLARDFAVSEMTIRRDLDILEEQGVVRKVMGGAIAQVGKATEPSFATRSSESVEEKAHLAELAVTMIQPHETVLLDSGSTVLALARAIRGRGLGLTVVTPSLPVALELADEPGTSVLVVGGWLRSGELSLVGAEAEQAFAAVNVDIGFFGVAGIDAERGASDYHREEAAMKRSAVRAAESVVIMVDSSKLGRTQLSQVADLGEIDVLVTDAAEDDPRLAGLRGRGVAVHCADARQPVAR